ncbi:glycosyltransferase [Neobacillus mesonae]|uniref:Glycosyl transferase family 1 domain-containing protein n=1 Tax=Neobacillus mesonae TaxID=1193713 RepID=A0A3Q9QZV4_9BACI|nr:glycosyltransferase [Neobacillus mesonae]AZU64484.1 hypothetical protein CHR53_26455 [Neobacillus mesonae]
MLKVLTFNGVYLPGYKAGGPIRSLVNMVSHFKDDLEFFILTRDRDAGDKEPYNNVQFNKWVKITNEKVYYQNENKMSIWTLRKIINSQKYDVVLLNGILSEYTIRYLLLRKLRLIKAIPTIIMPRGDLAKGALSLKANKKSLYLKVAKKLKLYNNLIWLATSKGEKNDTKIVFEKIDIVTIPNLPSTDIYDNSSITSNKKTGTLRIVYISRITKVKNLLFALEALNEVNGVIVFDIYGPISDEEYWGICQKYIKKMKSNIRVNYYGSLSHDKVQMVMRNSDVFLLPTLGENYGHVIVEALMSGTPIIISDQTPWRNLESYKAGWDISLENKGGYTQAIQTLVNMDQHEHFKYKIAATKYISEALRVQETKNAYLELFRRVANDDRG